MCSTYIHGRPQVSGNDNTVLRQNILFRKFTFKNYIWLFAISTSIYFKWFRFFSHISSFMWSWNFVRKIQDFVQNASISFHSCDPGIAWKFLEKFDVQNVSDLFSFMWSWYQICKILFGDDLVTGSHEWQEITTGFFQHNFVRGSYKRCVEKIRNILYKLSHLLLQFLEYLLFKMYFF